MLDERLRGTRFVSLTPKRVLNPPSATGMDYWSLNPYVGCEFGCSYCYARYTHRYVVERAHDAGKLTDAEFADYRGAHGWEAFERRIFVKEQVVGALDADLKRVPIGATIVIGTATDPYQPAERRFRVTRAVLQRLARCEGLSFGIITKSPLIARDRDLLLRLQERNELQVHVSLITADARLARKLEARSPIPAARLGALKKLVDAGINAGLIVAPVLPGITDNVAHLDALFSAAREAGAQFIHAGPLRLYAAVRDRFIPLLAEHFPDLVPRYERAYARQAGAPRDYARALSRRVQKLQHKHGFAKNRGMMDRYRPSRVPTQGELELRGSLL
ncbi:MAG TPA: radical SAM protein [Gemmatimonadales bacterium]|nr:radical SAM protein [Gemmatimonadales bacterium]